ncbi:MAG: hypothetical protein QOF58_5194 [Pseudonocardiales bacterium]|nr:hypothetical protein [Pseudonocardiales bacterium]
MTVPPTVHPPPVTPAARAFESIYEAEFDVVMAYFARRTSDPQTAADLTADTFVAAITSFGTFDRTRGSARGWLLGSVTMSPGDIPAGYKVLLGVSNMPNRNTGLGFTGPIKDPAPDCLREVGDQSTARPP